MYEWVNEFPAAITVCDQDGIIIEMNGRSVHAFEKDGGAGLIGKNALDCHPEPARSEMRELLASGKTNVYTIEKRGVKKLIFQSPWYHDGVYRGFVELMFEIPFTLPHHIRT
jgi:transcriptional regulator with PAS, ATPase and Fis domain